MGSGLQEVSQDKPSRGPFLCSNLGPKEHRGALVCLSREGCALPSHAPAIPPQLTRSGGGCLQPPSPGAPFHRKVVLPGKVSPYLAELNRASSAPSFGPGSVLQSHNRKQSTLSLPGILDSALASTILLKLGFYLEYPSSLSSFLHRCYKHTGTHTSMSTPPYTATQRHIQSH